MVAYSRVGLSKTTPLPDEIQASLFDPAEVDQPAYGVIYQAVSAALQSADSGEALESAITTCDELMGWAGSIKEMLMRLRD
jgi:hypothetical protein